ncbi:hypothetical protein B0H14DRAFT_2596338 [Mycena olivaceomarginata]|nr:hypothetical protein B0H14DRAFT_2596338 [Mycena olivaceomarginata]
MFILLATIEPHVGVQEGVFDLDTPSLDSKPQAHGWILLRGDIQLSLTPSTQYHSCLSVFEGKKKNSGSDIAQSATTFHSPCMRGWQLYAAIHCPSAEPVFQESLLAMWNRKEGPLTDVYCTSQEISGSARAGIEGNGTFIRHTNHNDTNAGSVVAAFVLHHELAEPKTEVAGRDT